MAKLVLLRHGQSVWNLENRFTGWTDVDLTDQGIEEAHHASKELCDRKIHFDIAITSVLKRAIRTLWIVLDEMDMMWIPVVRDWRLNERHYGALQGLYKVETAKKLGPEQVYLWRRSFVVPPPALSLDDPRHPIHDKRYSGIDPDKLPATESLKDTLDRVMLCWEEEIIPYLKKGQCVLVIAHGNSLRALVKYLDQISDQDVPDLNIPTGIPRLYEFDSSLNITERYYLGDPEAIKKAAEAVKKQAIINQAQSGS